MLHVRERTDFKEKACCIVRGLLPRWGCFMLAACSCLIYNPARYQPRRHPYPCHVKPQTQIKRGNCRNPVAQSAPAKSSMGRQQGSFTVFCPSPCAILKHIIPSFFFSTSIAKTQMIVNLHRGKWVNRALFLSSNRTSKTADASFFFFYEIGCSHFLALVMGSEGLSRH